MSNPRDLYKKLEKVEDNLKDVIKKIDDKSSLEKPYKDRIQEFMEKLGLDDLEALKKLGRGDMTIEQMAEELGLTPDEMQNKLDLLDKVLEATQVLDDIISVDAFLIIYGAENIDSLKLFNSRHATDAWNAQSVEELLDFLFDMQKNEQFISLFSLAPTINGDLQKVSDFYTALNGIKIELILAPAINVLKDLDNQIKELLEKHPEIEELMHLQEKMEAVGLNEEEMQRIKELTEDPDVIQGVHDIERSYTNLATTIKQAVRLSQDIEEPFLSEFKNKLGKTIENIPQNYKTLPDIDGLLALAYRVDRALEKEEDLLNGALRKNLQVGHYFNVIMKKVDYKFEEKASFDHGANEDTISHDAIMTAPAVP